MATNDLLPNKEFYTGQAPAGPGSPTKPASQGGPIPPGQVPPPGVNPDVIYTDQSGKGYNQQDLQNAWSDPSFKNNPANARVGDILGQYPNAAPQAPGNTPPSGALGAMAAGAGQLVSGQIPGYTPAPNNPQMDQLLQTLMSRANQSLNLDPNDPIIKNQVDAFNANNIRSQRSYLSQAAEKGGPNANLDAVSRSMAEKGAQDTNQLQSSLMSNELSARRQEIQNALSESGSLLTSQQQLALQRELGLIDSQLRQQQINSGNDQFAAQLGLSAQNQKNYWDAIQSGLL